MPSVILRTLDGRLKISPDGSDAREQPLSAGGTGRRGPAGSGAGRLALCADGALGADRASARTRSRTAMAVFRPDLYDAAAGGPGKPPTASDAIGAFAGPAFNPADITGHLAAFKIGHRKS